MIKLSRGKKILLWGIAIVLVMLIAEALAYIIYESREEPRLHVSVILSSAQTDRWENLRLGAEQAAGERRTEINIITMSVNADAQEQIAVINRELVNGTDAVIIEAADSRLVEEYFHTVACDVPVIFLYSGSEHMEDAWYVAVDNYEMGHALAEDIIEKEWKWVKVAIVLDDMQKQCVAERYQGVYDALADYADEVVIWEKDDTIEESTLPLFLQEKMIEEAVDVVVTLDNQRTEAIIDAAQNLNKDIRIYGIGNSDKVVHYLDEGLVKAIAYPNDFSAGYLSMNIILQKKRQDKGTSIVEYKIVDREKMYTQEYEKVIFPFVK